MTVLASISLFMTLPTVAHASIVPSEADAAVGTAGAFGTAGTADTAGTVGTAGTDVNDFTFRSMNADYTLGRDPAGASTLKVVETFVAVFPESDQNHGMKRSIPDSYQGQPNDPQLVSITDGEGKPRPASVTNEDGVFTMTSRDPGFVHGDQTYVFTYTLRHVTQTFPDAHDDELYWDVNGVDWAQPFGQVSATVHLGTALQSARNGRQSCYVGGQGSTTRCDIASEGGTVTTSVPNVQPYQTVTIAVGFTEGTFVPFDTSALASGWGIGALVSALAGLVALVLAAVARARWLRDAPGRPTIIAEYTPPAGMDALEAALLLGRDPKGVPAEVLEQAVGGSIRIVEVGHKLSGSPRLAAELVDASRADADGRLLLDALFAKGPSYTFGKQDRAFASAAQKIVSTVRSDLVSRGYYRKVPASARLWPMLLGILGAAGMIVCTALALSSFVTPWPITGVFFWAGIVVVGVIGLLAHRPLDARGSDSRDHLKGLRQFIEWTDAERIRVLQSPSGAERVPVNTSDPRQMLKLYETLLPFALVFGQEKQWSKQLAVYSEASGVAPAWYIGANAAIFDAASFSSGIGALSAVAISSSSSGGSGGGGFAGGGGGGGGGGGV